MLAMKLLPFLTPSLTIRSIDLAVATGFELVNQAQYPVAACVIERGNLTFNHKRDFVTRHQFASFLDSALKMAS